MCSTNRALSSAITALVVIFLEELDKPSIVVKCCFENDKGNEFRKTVLIFAQSRVTDLMIQTSMCLQSTLSKVILDFINDVEIG